MGTHLEKIHGIPKVDDNTLLTGSSSSFMVALEKVSHISRIQTVGNELMHCLRQIR